MTTAIRTTQPLCVICQSNDKKLFFEGDIQELDELMSNSYMEINWQRISTARNLIRQYWPASPVEYYEYFILPKLPAVINSRMSDLLERLSDKDKAKVGLDILLSKQRYFEDNEL